MMMKSLLACLLYSRTLVGVLYFSSLCVVLAGPKVDLPAGEEFAWGKEPVVATSSTRSEMVLNGLWLFQPAQAGAASEPKDKWAAIRVPGAWDSQPEWGNMTLPSFVGALPKWAGIATRTDSDKGSVFIEQVTRGWYEREISVPKEWAGKKVVLSFERISTDAEVFINGKNVGVTHWPGGEVDITTHLSAGSTGTLRVLVTAVGSEKELLISMREDYADKGNSGLRQRGIIGDVILSAQPMGAHLDGLAIKTTAMPKELSVTTQLMGLKSAAKGKFTATLKEWPSGVVAKTFNSEIEVSPDKLFTLTWPWAEAKFWDIGQPNLYTLSLKVEAAGVVDEVTERFGFREIKIEGRNFILNGTPFFGRTSHAGADNSTQGNNDLVLAETRRALALGYNVLEIWPNDNYRRGFGDFRAAYARGADETGIFVLMPVVRPDELFNWNMKVEESAKQTWLSANRRHMNQVRNNPSVMGYLFYGNEFMTADDQNPLRIGNKKALAESQQRNVAPALELIEDLRKLDPTRFVTSHSNANVGDVHTGNHYLGLTPLQEREETLAYWAQTSDMPYGAVEFCSPFSADLHRARQSWNTASEALATEFMAGILGPKAYEQETAEYRTYVKANFNIAKGVFEGWPGGLKPRQVGYIDYEPYRGFQNNQIEKIWRSWRSYGVSLGMIQWEKIIESKGEGVKKMPPFELGRRGTYRSELSNKSLLDTLPDMKDFEPTQTTYYKSIQPQMAYLGGALDKTDGWVSKDPRYSAGQQIRKSVVILNDGRTLQNYTGEWLVADETGKVVAKKELKDVIKIGEKMFLPIEFVAPTVTKETLLTLKLSLKFSATETAYNVDDEMKLHVFPALAVMEKKVPIVTVDPEGKTTASLRRLGYAPVPWKGEAIPAGTVLVIGRRAMSAPDFNVKAFKSAVQNGAHAILFSQDPQLLRDRAGLRVHQWVNRQFWPVETQQASILLTGLAGDDFTNWSGAGTLRADRNEDNLKESALRRGYPIYGYRVGSRGSVSSAAWEKPHYSGWTPLLEGEFDMAYSPLLELAYGKGYLLSFSLDVEDRVDPVADMLVRRAVETALAAKPQPKRQVFYSGDEATETWLKSSSLVFSKLSGSVPAKSLVIIGPSSPLDEGAIRSLLAGGSDCLLLGHTEKKLAIGINTKSSNYGAISSSPLPEWPELRGVSSSELRLRADKEISLIQASSNVQVAANGLIGKVKEGSGVLIAFQGHPLNLEADKKQYYRFSEWRWTRAISQILTNMGAVYGADDMLFNLTRDPFVPVELAGEWKIFSENSMPPSPSPDQPSVDPGIKDLALSKTEFDDGAWKKVALPAMEVLGEINTTTIDGSFWVRRTITVPTEWKNKGDMDLVLGVMDDHDTTYFNGTKVGGVGVENKLAWSTPRTYRIPAWMVKPGEQNTIAIRLFDQYGGGGFGASGAPLSMRLELRKKQESASVYVPGFQTDRAMGDDPARYTRW